MIGVPDRSAFQEVARTMVVLWCSPSTIAIDRCERWRISVNDETIHGFGR
jgi:hypothetical protein